MKRAGFRGFLTALTGLACTCAAAAEPQAAPVNKPALWELSDSDTTIYLFGTIHLLPPGTQWRTPAIDQALKASNMLVMEVKLSDDQTAIAQVLVKLGTSPGLPPLAERVPADKRPLLERALRDANVPANALDGMETWAASLLLLSTSFAKIGLSSGEGVERQLTAESTASNKQIGSLETPEQQLGYFDHLSEEAQRKLLVGVIDDPDAAQSEFQMMLKSWLAGDVPGIAKSFDTETALSPELRDVLMHRRNAAWADWLRNRLKEPGTIFVAVGAGHLAGGDSVQNILEKQGLRVKRLE
jgi:uncharacterized protein